ncbi:MAG: gamma-glutamyl-gamma-aminobutyrate hydrolase family protein [Clostridia bacterium]|nr:gamma-glutamyl-gamma-aminobutyrate hydrolase family protein [Clostridia bacterium]
MANEQKPLIALVPLWDEEKQSLWMLPGYMEGLQECGAVPIMLPLAEDDETLVRALSVCQGVLLTGGQDVDPALYGEANTASEELCTARDRMEKRVLDIALALDLSVLGICRGHQLVNVLLGGTLFQDLPSQYPSEVCHRQPPPYDLPSHTVTLPEGTPLSEILGCREIRVNSCHHQGVRDLADTLQGMAYAPDGLCEAAYAPGFRFVWTVQWHPEFSFRRDEVSRKIFAAFVRAANEAQGI